MFIPIHDHNPRQYIHFHYATFGLIALNIAAYFLIQTTGSDVQYGLSLLPAALGGDVARPDQWVVVPEEATLLTYAFLHADIWHLAGNMVFLWVFGDNVEDALGHWRFVLFYCLCAIGAGALQFWLTPESTAHTIGASGAVAGIVAAYLILHPRVRVWILLFFRVPLRLSALWVLGAWIIYQLWSAVNAPDVGVAWWAHVGGIATGALLVLVLRRDGVPLFDRGLPSR